MLNVIQMNIIKATKINNNNKPIFIFSEKMWNKNLDITILIKNVFKMYIYKYQNSSQINTRKFSVQKYLRYNYIY